jgi:diguanylate cyclase (GGDEF)-like protein
MKVLIADDDPISRRLLEVKLQQWGYEVEVASGGKEAWRALQSRNGPKLAVLDWMMPDMDGLAICKEVRKEKAEAYVYIILLTAKSQKQDIVQGIEAGADDYIVKPFDAHELKARLWAGTRILRLHADLLAMRETLHEQATHDALTGLPNRLLLSDRLSQRLADTRRSKESLAVMFADLDHFKYVNDTLGHNVGDCLLKQVAERLKTSLREVDTVARMGGDEFTLILANLSHAQQSSAVAQRVLEVLSKPFIVEGHELFTTASIGIATNPTDGNDAKTLIRNADAAMYRAKEQGRNRFQLYTEALNVRASRRMKLENSLRRAVEREQLLVHYQPLVDLKTGAVLGTEALVRWQHAELGLLLPDQFIAIAEETGLIVPIGEWVLHTACFQNKQWQNEGFPSMEMAVNISMRQFHQSDVVAAVRTALEDAGLDPRYLTLELTESTLMHDAESAVETLRELKAMGVQVSIDDFGTGHSSLSQLKRLPIDAVKIDPSFIQQIATDPEDAAIAGAVIAMAHSMHLKVVAEGVETLDQLEFLRSLNCDKMQGYLVSRPASAEELTNLMRQRRSEEDRLQRAA